MPIIPRIDEHPIGYLTSSIVVMEPWEAFTSLRFNNEATQCSNKAANEGRTSKSWTKRMGRQCNHCYPYRSRTKGMGRNIDEYVNP